MSFRYISFMCLIAAFGCTDPVTQAPGGGGNIAGSGGSAGQGGNAGNGGQQTGCPDRDRDGYQDSVCNNIANANPRGGDCNDYDNQIHPGRNEDCGNTIDNDCNNLPPNNDPFCRMQCDDRDRDGFQDIRCNGDRRTGGDCDDQDPSVNPGATETCGNGKDDDCAGGDIGCLMNCVDNDLDGFGRGSGCYGPDCDDRDRAVNPWATDVCGDRIDQNCDGRDTSCRDNCQDNDRDGFGQGDGCLGFDCNDRNPNVNPGARDIPGDNLDQDCDGRDLVIPDGCRQDNDGDGYGRDAQCLGLDCDDNNPLAHQGRVEICDNMIDDDCVGGDQVCVGMGSGACMDQDGDQYGAGACPRGDRDCDEQNPNVNPGAEERCNGVDDDCDDRTDECPFPQQTCEGVRCVGQPGAPCNNDQDCMAGRGLHCNQDINQCRVLDGQPCNDTGECNPSAECGLNNDCGGERRCYQQQGARCGQNCDCGGKWECHQRNGRCVECQQSADCNRDHRNECSRGGFCLEYSRLGGGQVIRQIELCEDTCNDGRVLCEENCFEDEDLDGILTGDEENWSNDGACDDGGEGSAFAVCELGTDCIDCGPRETGRFDGQCDDSGPDAQFDLCPLGTDCTDCGVRIQEVQEGGGAGGDALVETLDLMVQCWQRWNGGNENQGCNILDLGAEIQVDGVPVNSFGTTNELEDVVCDGGDVSNAFIARLQAAGFGGPDIDTVNDLVGCGLLNLRNIFWDVPVRANTNGDYCIYYAPAKGGFGFPQPRRSAIVVETCDLSVLD